MERDPGLPERVELDVIENASRNLHYTEPEKLPDCSELTEIESDQEKTDVLLPEEDEGGSETFSGSET